MAKDSKDAEAKVVQIPQRGGRHRAGEGEQSTSQKVRAAQDAREAKRGQ